MEGIKILTDKLQDKIHLVYLAMFICFLCLFHIKFEHHREESEVYPTTSGRHTHICTHLCVCVSAIKIY